MMMRMTAPLAIGALWRQAQRSMVCRQLQQRWQHQGNAEKELLVQRSKNNMITTLTLNRPKANAMGKALMEQFTAAVEELEECSDTRCVILTSSSPRVFSAGADLKERAGMNLEEAEQTVTGLRNTLQRFASLPMPTIAVVEGVAVGGGLELALAADWMVASRTASFGLPETSLGIIPGAGGTQRLARLIGPARALELIATAQRFTAEAAYDYGIVQHLVEPGMGDEKALE
jgi:methylglutaconyl-CoA hydratase